MKSFVWFPLVAVLAAGWTRIASAHFPEEALYPVFLFPDSLLPTMDGDLNDWEVVPERYWNGRPAARFRSGTGRVGPDCGRNGEDVPTSEEKSRYLNRRLDIGDRMYILGEGSYNRSGADTAIELEVVPMNDRFDEIRAAMAKPIPRGLSDGMPRT